MYFEIAYFLGKRGQEGLRQLTKTSFIIKTNPQGKEYIEMTFNESTKKSQGDDINEMNDQPIILSQPNKASCPVKSFKLYLSKLTDIPDFFQKPNPYYKRPTDAWFHKAPVGENTIGKFLSVISKNSDLSTRYTNHSIRGTTATAMYRSGYSLHDIASVTRHKNIESLKHYLEQPTLDDMKNYSDSLFKYADNSDTEDFQPAQPIRTKPKNATKTNEINNSETALVPRKSPQKEQAISLTPHLDIDENDTPDTLTQNTNFMQMFKQNPVGMFMGAKLANCTININMPK